MKPTYAYSLVSVFVIAVLLTAVKTSANNYTCCGNPVKWGGRASFDLDPGSFGNGGPGVDRFLDAISGWTSLPGSQLGTDVVFSSSGNVVSFKYRGPVGVLAQTDLVYGPCFIVCDEEITQMTMTFYNSDTNDTQRAWNFNALPGAYFQRQVPDPNRDPGFAPSDTAQPISFVEVASHELGHAFGFDHSTRDGSRMVTTYPNNGWFHRGLGTTGGARATALPYDGNAFDSLYPGSSSAADLFLISWQRAGTNSGLPVTANESGGPTSFYPVNLTADRDPSNPNDTAAKIGDTISLRICMGNNGNLGTTPTGKLEMFLSTDQEVDTNDALSGTVYTWSGPNAFPRFSFSCFDLSFVVPNVTFLGGPGFYFVGLWLDRGSFQGKGTNNNVTILGRRLKVVS